MQKKTDHLEGKTVRNTCLTNEEILRYERFTLKILEDMDQTLTTEEEIMNYFQSELKKLNQKSLKQQEELNKELEEGAYEIDRLINQHNTKTNDAQEQISRLEQNLIKNTENCKQMRKQKERIYNQRFIVQRELAQEESKLAKIQSEILEVRNQYQMYVENQQQFDVQIERLKGIHRKQESDCQEMFALKKKLNNQLQDVKGNIRVYCRIRPGRSKDSVIHITSENTLELTQSKKNVRSQNEKCDKPFYFDLIFGPTDSQDHIFTEISQLVQNAIDGNNVCLFVYGQTGSGKTYTMHGPDDDKVEKEKRIIQRGLTSRSIELIFQEIQNNLKLKWNFQVFCSIQEIYLETVKDLMANKIIEVDQNEERQMISPAHIQYFLNQAKVNRKMTATNCNERSSRSHLIVTIRIEGKKQFSQQKRNGSLVLIDLAGSQRIKKSKVQGLALKETISINKSLSCLGNVLNQLRRGYKHVSYRNSILTQWLEKYLQGQGKTLMIVNISPDEEDEQETKRSLIFGQGARETKVNTNK